MLTVLATGLEQTFSSLHKTQNITTSQTATTKSTTDAQAATSAAASGGFTVDAAEGQLTLSGQGEWTPEDLYTGLPEELMKEYAAVTGAEQQDWQAFTKDVSQGNLQSAQADLASYEQMQPGGGGASQDSALKALSAALSSGNQTVAGVALATATQSLTNQSIGTGALPVLLAQAANDAQSTPNWIQELDNFGGNLAPATINETQNSGDAFTQDLEAIQQAVTAGTSGLANFLESQGYSSDLATADAQMVGYKWTVDSLSTVVHDVANETGSGATFEISSSLTSVGAVDGTERAYSLSTDEVFSGNTGIKNLVTESELALTATGAIATAAAVEFGPSRPLSATASASVDRNAAAEALSSLSGYQTSFSVTETQSRILLGVAVEQTATEVSTGSAQSGKTANTLTVNEASASVAEWVQTVESYSAGKSLWNFESADHTASAKIDTSFESAAHETLEIMAMTLSSYQSTNTSFS